MQNQDLPELTPEMLEQNPGLLVLLFLASAMMILVVLASLATWGWMTYRATNGASILPLRTPWYPRLWSLLDLGIVIGLIVVMEVLFFGIASMFADSDNSDSPPMIAIAAGGLAHLIAVLLGTLWIQMRYRQGPDHTGFGPIPVKSFVVAVLLGISSLPLVYILMTIVSQASQTEYDHPLINSAAESGTIASYLLACFAAVITAPIAEEIFFRVLLQGWLQSIPFSSASRILVGVPSSLEVARTNSGPIRQFEQTVANQVNQPMQHSILPNDPMVVDPPRLSDLGDSSIIGTLHGAENPYQSPLASGSAQDLIADVSNESQTAPTPEVSVPVIPPVWPSVVVGTLFGLAHLQAGWSCIPLAVLGTILGLVYRQTHSVWPCILIHATLNSLSMLMLGAMIMLKQAAS